MFTSLSKSECQKTATSTWLFSKQNLMFFDLMSSMPGMLVFLYIWNVHNLSVEKVLWQISSNVDSFSKEVGLTRSCEQPRQGNLAKRTIMLEQRRTVLVLACLIC